MSAVRNRLGNIPRLGLIQTLNVAGLRHSKEPKIGEFVREVGTGVAGIKTGSSANEISFEWYFSHFGEPRTACA